MTGPDQPPLRWERDSAEEDFEAARIGQAAALDRWALEQPAKRLIDALESHGLIREDRESSSRYIVPDWWTRAEPPERACPWCQAPAENDVICDACQDAQNASADPPSLIGWWESLSPLGRRFHLGAEHEIDPWTGQQCRIEVETTTIDEQAGVGISCSRLRSVVPRTSWNLLREG